MYVYKQTETSPDLFTVGFYTPEGTWEPDSDHGEREKAANRVAYLNGEHESVIEEQYDTTMNLGFGTKEGFQLLAEEKLALVTLLSNGTAPDILNGLVHFIDYIQDTLVDKKGVPENLVFPKL